MVKEKGIPEKIITAFSYMTKNFKGKVERLGVKDGVEWFLLRFFQRPQPTYSALPPSCSAGCSNSAPFLRRFVFFFAKRACLFIKKFYFI